MNIRFVLLITACLYFNSSWAQHLQPGFDPNEYAELLRITARQRGPIPDSLFPEPLRFKLSFTSDSLGMDNSYQIWTAKSDTVKQAVISLRATTIHPISWAENLYCPMIPAKGQIKIADDLIYDYQFAEHADATVHLGWLIGTAFIERDVIPRLLSLYDSGIKDIYIFGHSQGGAISYLLTSSLHYMQENGAIPKDIQFKTYGSAAPKPGNLFYAYDFEKISLGGWFYNVVSDQDWVPEAPMSIQTVDAYSVSNPFLHINKMTKDLSLIKKIVVRGKFNGVKRNLTRAERKMNRIMGKQFTTIVKGYLKEYKPPKHFDENANYQRAGNQRTLVANAVYFDYLPDAQRKYFRNHMMDAYQLLLEIYYGDLLHDDYKIYLNKRYPFLKNPPIPKSSEQNSSDKNKKAQHEQSK